MIFFLTLQKKNKSEPKIDNLNYYLLIPINFNNNKKKKELKYSIVNLLILRRIISSNIIIPRPRGHLNLFKLLLRSKYITLRFFTFICLSNYFISAGPWDKNSWFAVSIKHSRQSIAKTIALALFIVGFVSSWSRCFTHFVLAYYFSD